MYQTSQGRAFFFSFLISAAFVLLLCFFFEPIWETRDDLQMAMLIHGFGVAIRGSSQGVFSNVLWGDLVRSIPTIHGVLGYSIATLSVLVISGAVLFYGLRKLGAGLVLSLSMLVLLLARPVLFPQFTINAGLLTVSAILLFHLYARQKNLWILSLGVLLAFLGYLIRAYEFILVFLVALPILPWRALIQERAPKIAILILGCAMLITGIYDKQAYEVPEWQPFFEMNLPRAAFTDFGAVDVLKKNTAIYQFHGYSANDLDLLNVWFFADPEVANPAKMAAMLKDLGPNYSIKKAWRGLRPLYRSILLPSVLCALALALIFPAWRVAIAWGLCISALALFGFIGRPGIIRIYVPLISLLCIAPIMMSPMTSRIKIVLASLVVSLAAAFAMTILILEQKKVETRMLHVQETLSKLPAQPLIIWGAALDFEALYPLFKTRPETYDRHFYFIAWSTLTPDTYAFNEEKNGRWFLTSLTSPKGIEILMDDYRLGLLTTYCAEHMNGQLKISNVQRYPELKVGKHISLARYQCHADSTL